MPGLGTCLIYLILWWLSGAEERDRKARIKKEAELKSKLGKLD